MRSAREKPRMRLSILQETTVPQVFSLSIDQTIDAPSTSLRLINRGKNAIARTLSRAFWQ